ncbi:Zn-dependent alcohol dehydrogenase [Brevibacterium sanguinis]|uniref:Zn-dependent alcohol dehydrogenase n=4 Tax=Brevibacterium TaxID=1696 RepID=A0A366IQ64_9MICO|nr:Zn-dependent alcohol dehydrogenase [Brevibacterium sanguinis]RBP74491.1 Zn-dependent alcohol dehydrogenase [Brevibacterium celere]
MKTQDQAAANDDGLTRAFVLEGPNEPLREEFLVLSEPREEEVLIEVAACGVCHTDLHVMKDEVRFPTPAVLGHEVSGIVRSIGPNVVDVQPGDRVVCSFIMPCGACRHCADGLEDICVNFFEFNRLNGKLYDGTTRIHRQNGDPVSMYSMGGHATHCVVPSRAVFPLPDEVPLGEAALLGCSLFTAYGAVRSIAEVTEGETVAVVAAGGIGLSIIHLARAFGAERVIAIDIDDEKLALAAEFGATDVVNSADRDPVDAVKSLCGRGVDVAFEALGSQPTVKLAVSLLDDGGRAVLAGIAPVGHTMDIDITQVVRRKLRILGSFGASASGAMPAVIELAARGHIDLQKLITQRFGFDEIPLAYELLDRRQIRGRGLVEINPTMS